MVKLEGGLGCGCGGCLEESFSLCVLCSHAITYYEVNDGKNKQTID
jgi:hypothetical protein